MNLFRLSLASILVCLAGLAALFVATVGSIEGIRENHAAERQLLVLHDRLDVFNATSDRMLLLGANPAEWAAYQSEANELRDALEVLGEQSPNALLAARRVTSMADAVVSALDINPPGVGSSRSGRSFEPLAVPTESRAVMESMVREGMVLDMTLSGALHARQTEIAREVTWIAVTLGGSALLFGLLCLFSFGLMHRRFVRPARTLAETLEQIRAGNIHQRAPVPASDELAHLTLTLNALLDEQQSAQRAMREKERHLEEALDELADQARLLDIAGRAARFGGWSADLRSRTIEWSDLTAEVHGLPPGQSPSLETAIDFYAPEHRDRIRELIAACAEHGTPYDEELEIISTDGQRHWIRTTGEAVRDGDGNIVKVQGAFQDISEKKQLEFEGQRLTIRMANMLEAITDGFIAFDEQWRYTYVNAAGARMIDSTIDELMGLTLWSRFPELVGSEFENMLRAAMEDSVSGSVEAFFEPLNKWFDVRAYPWEEGLAVFFQDVTENHRMLEQLKGQKAEIHQSRDALNTELSTRKALINSLPAHIAMLDAEGNVIDINQQWRHFAEQNDYADASFGVTSNYLTVCRAATGDCAEGAAEVAEGLRQVLAGQAESFALEYPCHSPDEQRWFRVVFNRLSTRHGKQFGAVAMHVDITERKLAEQELNRLAYEDLLTGLCSRNGFERGLQEQFDSTGWPTNGIVAVLNIVGLRDINDAHGYDIGDHLLVELGQRLRAQVGVQGLVGRTGGDEFVAHFTCADAQTPDAALREFNRITERPFDLNGLSIEIELRVGYTEMGDVLRSPEVLMREAELALSESRDDLDALRHSVRYNEALANRSLNRIQLTNELRHALEAGEFELHFQPKVNLADGSLVAAEALLRWQHPERGLQPPGLFIPLAERSQLIGPIGDWVLRDACRQLREWRDAGLDIVQVSVNVSLVQFQLGDFPAKVRAALEEFGVAPSELSLEITESVFERHSDRLLSEIRDLHDLGVRLSLDDFGTGYSSLQYLNRYPFDEVKIDRAFVSKLRDEPYSRDIVRSVMNVADALGAEVVAEGIESAEIAGILLQMGCRVGQGFYYSVPLATEDFHWLLEKHSNLPLVEATSGEALRTDGRGKE